MSLYLPILMYHQVGRPGAGEKPALFVPPEVLREQLSFLADAGFRGVTPDQLADALEGVARAGLPRKPVMVTFDDADARSLAPAFEVLAEMSWPGAAYFVAGSNKTFPSPAQVEDFRKLRVAVGSHCMTHRRLTELSEEGLRTELVESRRRLEVRVGYPIRHLAYPYGAFGKREVGAAREAGYRTALGVQRGNRHRRSDLLHLRRIPVRPDTSAGHLGRYLSRAWHLEHVLKELLGLEAAGKKR